jgi:uncharacterized membrane protein
MTDTPTIPSIAQKLDLEHITRSEFVNAMVHLYRGELGEATAWRSRIDTTTNWAVVLSATALSFVFSDMNSDRHVLILIVSLFCTFLMLMEARRYRFFDIWRSRARMIEINFYRPMLDGSAASLPEWGEILAHDMEWPHFHMPWWEAVGRRLRRNYQWIYIILLGSWVVVLMSHPSSTTSLAEIVMGARRLGLFQVRPSLQGCWFFTAHYLRWGFTVPGSATVKRTCRPVTRDASVWSFTKGRSLEAFLGSFHRKHEYRLD